MFALTICQKSIQKAVLICFLLMEDIEIMYTLLRLMSSVDYVEIGGLRKGVKGKETVGVYRRCIKSF